MDTGTPKQVLVTYLDRKKVLSIPQGSNVGDIDFLENEFLQVFGLSGSRSVTFQRFNSIFQEYVDLEYNCEINDKDKLQAIVTFSAKVSWRRETGLCYIIINFIKQRQLPDDVDWGRGAGAATNGSVKKIADARMKDKASYKEHWSHE